MPNAQWPSLLRPFRPLLYLTATALLVSMLYLAQAVFLPIALATMLTFILTTPVTILESKKVPRILAVMIVMLFTIGILGGFGYVLSRQFAEFAAQLPHYSSSIKTKFATLRATQKNAIADIQESVDAVSHELDKQERETIRAKGKVLLPQGTGTDLQHVMVVLPDPTDLERFRVMVEPVAAPIVHAGVVLILIIFMLVQREDLRDRVIRIIGPANVTLTTRTMDEMGHRIGRFLFSQTLINLGFGLIITTGLFAIGIPYPVLWGMVGALLRFVPYLGAILAMLMPAALAFVQGHGWAPTLETLALFIGADVLIGNVEPVVIGTHTGVSSLALLVSALFWTWLWGPIGLVLSTPLTVCLAVVGKHVPELAALAVLLSDEPPLEPEVSFYQRLLAGDDDEAEQIVQRRLHTHTRAEVFDTMIVPTLATAAQDRLREEISETEYQYVLRTTAAIVHHGAETIVPDPAPEGNGDSPPQRRSILAVPARNAADEVVLEMLTQALDSTWAVELLSTATLASEVVLAVEEKKPDVLCIGSSAPGGLVQARYLAKRVRLQCPAVCIWVVRPGQHSDPISLVDQLTNVGVDKVATAFSDVSGQLAQLLTLACGDAGRPTREPIDGTRNNQSTVATPPAELR
jgi:predicted PurR-regulated permease PerM